MITIRGSIPYPPTADAGPVRQFAAGLRELSSGLQRTSGELVGAVAHAQSSWSGSASDAFAGHMSQRSSTVRSVAASLAQASMALDTYATAIVTTSTAYSHAALAEHAARKGLPYTAGALAAAIAAEQAALAALHTAAAAAAGALWRCNAELAAAQLAGVDREAFAGIVERATDIWNGVAGLVEGEPDADAAGQATRELEQAVDVPPTAMAQPPAAASGRPAPAMAGPAAPSRTAPTTPAMPDLPPSPHLGQHDATPTAGSDRAPGLPQMVFGEAGDEVDLAVSLLADGADPIADAMERLRRPQLSIIDPMTGRPVVAGQSRIIDPATGRPVVAGQSRIIDPATGRPVVAGQSRIIDPATGRPVVAGQSPLLDPATGRRFALDPSGRSITGPVIATTPNVDGSLQARLDRIAREAASMQVNHGASPSAMSRVGDILGRAAPALRIAGRILTGVGVAFDIYDIYRGIVDDDPGRTTDAGISLGLTVLAGGALVLGAPVAAVALTVGGIGWAVWRYFSDEPITAPLYRRNDPSTAPRGPTTTVPMPISP